MRAYLQFKLTHSSKEELAKWIKELLKALNCSDSYRIEFETLNLLVREATSKSSRPTQQQRTSFSELMRMLAASGVLEYYEDTFKTTADTLAPCVRIHSRNEERFKEFEFLPKAIPWLREMLAVFGCSESYRVGFSNGYFRIRESSTTQPSQLQKSDFKDFIAMLKKAEMFELKDTTILLANDKMGQCVYIHSGNLGQRKKFQSLLLMRRIEQALVFIDCSNFYAVERKKGQLSIREKAGNPPSPEQKALFQILLKELTRKEICTFKKIVDERIVKKEAQKKQSKKISCWELHNINYPALKKSKWGHILLSLVPRAIYPLWHEFSLPLRCHILKCCASDGSQYVAKIYKLKFFNGHKPASPISHEVPKIPVFLPNDHLGVENETYDLVELLKIRERHPENPALLPNPMTREFFRLSDILPRAEEPQPQTRAQSGPK